MHERVEFRPAEPDGPLSLISGPRAPGALYACHLDVRLFTHVLQSAGGGYASWCDPRSRRRPSLRACGRRRGFGPPGALALDRRLLRRQASRGNADGRHKRVAVHYRIDNPGHRGGRRPHPGDPGRTAADGRVGAGLPPPARFRQRRGDARARHWRLSERAAAGRIAGCGQAGHSDPVVVHRFLLSSRFSPMCPSATGVEVVGECAGKVLVNTAALLPPLASANDRVHNFGRDHSQRDIPRRIQHPRPLNTFRKLDYGERE
jgi:hypothetical protein